MKILDTRVLKIGNYEYPQIMVTKDASASLKYV